MPDAWDRAEFRQARPDEAEAITALVVRSKRHWGYPDAFIEAMTPVMSFTRADLEHLRARVEVLELSLIHISEPTRPILVSRMPSSA